MSYSNCFQKHPFEELNSIDEDKLTRFMNIFLQTHKLNENSNIFDVGTNAGSFIKVLNRFNILKNIHCFEPHPVLSSKVQEIYPHVKMNEFCLGNTNDNINIYIPEHSVGLSSIVRRPVFDSLNQTIDVLNTKCQKLDDYCKENNIEQIDFIKIDVEGAEKCIFEGAHSLLSAHKIIAGIFEVGNTLTDAGTSTEEVCQIVERYGYKINKSIYESDYYFYL